jgi:ABC-type bacteriocin/lantibiotic exporter with double-glycine peptidase domain
MAILRGQRTNYDCGPTCFANTLNILGYDIKIQQANELCGLTSEGTDSTDLIRAFDKYGFDGREKTCFSRERALDWLIRDTNKGLPVIISVDDDSHWALVLRAGSNRIQIFDPDDEEPTLVGKRELIDRWEYFEDNSIRSKFNGIRIIPFKEKSIKAVLLREKLLETIDVK